MSTYDLIPENLSILTDTELKLIFNSHLNIIRNKKTTSLSMTKEFSVLLW